MIESFNFYFAERKKLAQQDGWIGKTTASEVLKPIYLALRSLKLNLIQLLIDKNIRWTVQPSIGQGAATPDHYVAILPPKQKVSDGLYFCICFDRDGMGVVMGVMTSLLTPQHVAVPTIVRAEPVANASNQQKKWKMIPPNTVNVWAKNNAFYNPIEMTDDYMSNDPDSFMRETLNHIDSSIQLVQSLIDKKNSFHKQ